MSHPSDRRAHTLAVWTALIVTVLWSSSWVLIRHGLDDEALPPLTFAGLRYALAAVVLLAWVLASPRARTSSRTMSRRDLMWLAVLGVGFYALTQGAQFVAIDHQPAATTSLVLSLTPLAVALLSARSVGEATTRRQIVGAALVVAGAVLYFAGDLGSTVIGMLAAVVGLTANVGSSLLGRSVNRAGSLPAVVITAVSMTVGASVLLAGGVIVEGVPEVSGRAALIIAWLAIVNTALAFTLWNLSLRRLTATESAGLNNTMLVQIAVLAWIFLDEPPGAAAIAGIVIVSAGIFLTRSPRSTRHPHPDRRSAAAPDRGSDPDPAILRCER